MKARSLFVILFLGITLLAVGRSNPGEATAVAQQGTMVPAEEALQALAYGRLVATSSQPDGTATAAEGPESPVRMPEEAGAPADLSGDIAFASNRSGAVYNLYTQNAAGGPANLFVSSAGHDVTPSWSPDGSLLVYASDRSGNFEIYLRNATGFEKRLTDNAFQDIHPSWSPDGQRILFASNRNGSYYQVFTMDLNGQYIEQVGVVFGNTLWPRYSPDGSRIAFMRASIAIPACDWNWDIWTMDAAGNNQVRVTTQLGGDLYPGWTPDGRIIYASCRNFIDSDLFIVDPNTGAEVRLNNWPFSDEWHATIALAAISFMPAKRLRMYPFMKMLNAFGIRSVRLMKLSDREVPFGTATLTSSAIVLAGYAPVPSWKITSTTINSAATEPGVANWVQAKS